MYFQNIFSYGGLSPKPLEWLLVFHAPSGGRRPRETPLGNDIYLSKYPRWCTFRIYIIMRVCLQNPKSGCLFSMLLQEGDALWKWYIYTYQSTLGNVLSEYIWLCGYISKTLGVVVCVHTSSGGRRPRVAPFGNKIYLSKYPGWYTFRIYLAMGVYL